ncbi:glycosyltransferase [Patescibacteria group bacterium]|nr:glycosyltransferase [Patescibacteria group bacterium]
MKIRLLSVIIPCFNEENNLKRGVLQELASYLNKQRYKWEVLICDDGSADNSKKAIQEFVAKNNRFRLIEISHAGKPHAIYAGVKSAVGDIFLFTDMDQSTSISEVEKLLPWFDRGYDIVIGSRGLKREGFSATRKVASVVFRYLRGLFVLSYIVDTQCGFKAIKADLAREIFPLLSYFRKGSRLAGWSVSAYDAEMLFIADKWGYKLKEVFVKWKDNDISDTKKRSSVRFIHQSINMAKEVINVVINNWRGTYSARV